MVHASSCNSQPFPWKWLILKTHPQAVGEAPGSSLRDHEQWVSSPRKGQVASWGEEGKLHKQAIYALFWQFGTL